MEITLWKINQTLNGSIKKEKTENVFFFNFNLLSLHSLYPINLSFVFEHLYLCLVSLLISTYSRFNAEAIE